MFTSFDHTKRNEGIEEDTQRQVQNYMSGHSKKISDYFETDH